MQKRISFFLCLALLLGLLSGCGSTPAASANQLSVVTTIFPEYDWVRQILGDKADGVDLIMLLDNGVDLHSYQPTADDMVKISTCDLFIYVGGESDEWVEDALAEAVNQDITAFSSPTRPPAARRGLNTSLPMPRRHILKATRRSRSQANLSCTRNLV